MNILRFWPHHVLNVQYGHRKGLKIGCAVSKIKHVFVVERLTELPGIRIRKTSGKVTHSQLPVLVMAEITPVLLNMHFVRIQRSQVYPLLLVFLHQRFKKNRCIGIEIIHFLRFIFQHHHDPAVAQIFRLVTKYMQEPHINALANSACGIIHGVGCFVSDVGQGNNVFSFHHPVWKTSATFFERVGFHPG